MRVALVHDFLNQFGGAERVLFELSKMFPEAPIYTSLYDETKVGKYFPREKVKTTWLQKLPKFLRKRYRLLLPLYPLAFEMLDLRDFDLVISSSGAWCKNVVVRSSTVHISYVHSPMRFAWDWHSEYLSALSFQKENFQDPRTKNQTNFKFQIPNFKQPQKIGGLKGFITRSILSWLRVWDFMGRDRADLMLANSKNTQKRIAKYYRRDSEIVYPPVDTEFFQAAKTSKAAKEGSYFLVVSRLSAYKNVDQVVRVFNKIKLPIVIAGTGSELENLQRLNSNDQTKFVGKVTDEQLRSLYQNARALVFPGEEDFGIVPVEAMACGTPVVGLGIGGLLETVTDSCGVLYDEPTEEELQTAIEEFIERETTFEIAKIRWNATRFSKECFKEKILKIVSSLNSKIEDGKKEVSPPGGGETSKVLPAVSKIDILGVKISNVTFAGAVEKVDQILQSGGVYQVTTPNLEFVMAAQKDEEFRSIINESALAIPDGAGLILASRLPSFRPGWRNRQSGSGIQKEFGKIEKEFLDSRLRRNDKINSPDDAKSVRRKVLKERVAGSDLIYALCDLSAKKTYKVYFLGGADGVAKQASEKLKLLNPNLKVVGAESGGMVDLTGNSDHDLEIAERIKVSGANLLFVAFGAPKQDKWIRNNIVASSQVPVARGNCLNLESRITDNELGLVAIGVGGSLDFVVGRQKRAPKVFQKFGLEWLYRLVCEPWRIGRMMALPKALIKVVFSDY